MNKTCSRCNLKKDITQFPIDNAKKSGHRSECKACQSITRKKSYTKNGKKERIAHKTWVINNKSEQKEYNRRTKLYKAYGITIDDWNHMFNDQNGCCAICGKHSSEMSRGLFVDHNHETSKVRSLLCHNCNLIIGHAFENIDILEKTILYINKHN